MSRHASDLPLKLLNAGKQILLVGGKLTVRKICEIAQVNVGLFCYYFSNKHNYFVQLLKMIYQELQEYLSATTKVTGNALTKLKAMLTGLEEFAAKHERLLLAINYDILLMDRKLLHEVARHFLKNELFLNLINECLVEKFFNTSLKAEQIFCMLIFGGFVDPEADVMKKLKSSNRIAERRERVRLILAGLISDKVN